MANVRGRQQAAERKDPEKFLVEKFVPSSAWTEDSTSHYLLVDLPGFKKEKLKLQVDDHGHVLASGERQVNENKIVQFEQTFKLPENSERDKITGKYESEILYVVVPKKVKGEEEERKTGTATNVQEVHKHAKEQEEAERVKGTASSTVVEEKREPEKKEEEKEAKRGKGTASSTVVEEKREPEKKEEEKEAKRSKGTAYVAEERHLHEENHASGSSYRHENGGNSRLAQELSRETWRQEAGLLGSVVEILSQNKGIVITAVIAFSLGWLVCQKFQSNSGTEGAFSPL